MSGETTAAEIKENLVETYEELSNMNSPNVSAIRRNTEMQQMHLNLI